MSESGFVEKNYSNFFFHFTLRFYFKKVRVCYRQTVQMDLILSHPFYYLLPSHTNKPLSPDTELLSFFSKHIHPLPALHFQPAASPPPSSLFSSSTRCSRCLVSIKCYPSSRLSCGMSFSLNQIQGNPLPWSINHLSVYTLLSLHKEN